MRTAAFRNRIAADTQGTTTDWMLWTSHDAEDPKDTTEGYHAATVKWIPLRLQDVLRLDFDLGEDCHTDEHPRKAILSPPQKKSGLNALDLFIEPQEFPKIIEGDIPTVSMAPIEKTSGQRHL